MSSAFNVSVTESGFCSYESTVKDNRGVFHWNETEVTSYASSSCYYGPPGVTVTRLCAEREQFENSSVSLCRTNITTAYNNIKVS